MKIKRRNLYISLLFLPLALTAIIYGLFTLAVAYNIRLVPEIMALNVLFAYYFLSIPLAIVPYIFFLAFILHKIKGMPADEMKRRSWKLPYLFLPFLLAGIIVPNFVEAFQPYFAFGIVFLPLVVAFTVFFSFIYVALAHIIAYAIEKMGAIEE